MLASESKNLYTGLVAEMQFACECAKRGWITLSPHNDIAPYDFVVDTGERLIKVQVKGTSVQEKKRKTFRLTTSRKDGKGNKVMYKEEDFDFYALYVEPKNTWYIVPINELKSKETRVIPEDTEHWMFPYEEAWELLEDDEY
jgi:hypothetical protein